ncbi:MAG: M23 family metallopeptidase [Chloroflexota bacterium]
MKTIRALFITLLLLLISCSAPEPVTPPTLIPLVDTPVFQSPEPTAPGDIAERVVETETAVSTPELTPETVDPGIPTPEGSGVRPQEAQQLFVPNAGPALSDEERPPTMSVPLSINPDDHYLLIRPIPSRSRNYDLEWYPFGNDVLRTDLEPYRIHHGLDFPNDTGTPVLAASSGTVIHAGPLPSPRNGVNYYGNTVIIEHDWEWADQQVFTLYAHTLELFVTVGDQVDQGQLIAGVGSSGEVSGPHLHFEVRVGQNLYGDARNPMLWMAPYEGMGTIAGRFVDRNGRLITSAQVQLRPVNVPIASRAQLTYHDVIQSDIIWNENFVFGDLPAGKYEVLLTGIDNIQYLRELEVRPGQTTFVTISTNFEFIPTPTPGPIATPEGDDGDEDEGGENSN